MSRSSHFRESKFEFLCEYRTYKPHTDMPYFHYHRYYEILYVLDGSRRILFENGKEYVLDRSGIALIQPGVAYRTFSASSREQSKFVIIASELFVEELRRVFSGSFFSCFDYGVITLDADAQQTVYKDLTEIRHTYNSVNYFSDKNKMLFLNLIYDISKSLEQEQKADKKVSNRDFVYQIKKHIDNNFAQHLSLTELAEMVSVTPSHLSREFRKKTGENVSDYILKMRMLHARRLLEGSSMSISEIAENVGFSSLNHFDKMFKKDHGLTPTEYMKAHMASEKGK